MKIANKALWVAVATATFMVAALEATPTKTGGFGLYNPATNFNESWMIDGQLPYIDINPASMGALNPQLYGDTDGAAQNEGGIMFKPVSNIFVGVFIGKQVYNANYATNIINKMGTDFNKSVPGSWVTIGKWVDENDPITGFPTLIPALNTRNISTILQMAMGNINLGLGLNYARTHYFNETVTTNPASTKTAYLIHTNMGIVLGADMKMGDMNIDASLGYKDSGLNNSFKSTASKEDITLTDKGLKDITADARVSMKLGGTNLLHTALGFALTGGSAEFTYANTTAGAPFSAAQATTDVSGMNIKLGVSDEMKISENIMSFVGIVYNRESITTGDTIGSTTSAAGVTKFPPTGTTQTIDGISNIVTLILGMEANLSESWMGRFGISSNIWNIDPKVIDTNTVASNTTTTTTSTFNDAGTNINFGLSYKLSNFSLDWNINKALLVNGPNFIGGTVPGMAASFGVNYAFDKK